MAIDPRLNSAIMFMVLDYFTVQEVIPSRVCSLWNEMFNRVVWRHCSIKTRPSKHTTKSLAKNAHHIWSLTYNGRAGAGLLLRLEGLTINANYGENALAKCLAVLPLLQEFVIGRWLFIETTVVEMERHFGNTGEAGHV